MKRRYTALMEAIDKAVKHNACDLCGSYYGHEPNCIVKTRVDRELEALARRLQSGGPYTRMKRRMEER